MFGPARRSIAQLRKDDYVAKGCAAMSEGIMCHGGAVPNRRAVGPVHRQGEGRRIRNGSRIGHPQRSNALIGECSTFNLLGIVGDVALLVHCEVARSAVEGRDPARRNRGRRNAGARLA